MNAGRSSAPASNESGPSVADRLRSVQKALGALAAGLAVMVSAGLVTGEAKVWAGGAIAAAIETLSVFLAPANR